MMNEPCTTEGPCELFVIGSSTHGPPLDRLNGKPDVAAFGLAGLYDESTPAAQDPPVAGIPRCAQDLSPGSSPLSMREERTSYIDAVGSCLAGHD
ncbi:MAG: hypothetical protein ACYCSF_03140 [Acidimicrobiales bacterium]